MMYTVHDEESVPPKKGGSGEWIHLTGHDNTTSIKHHTV